MSTECYTNWSHNYCVHRMLHELVTQLLCPQNVTRTATQSLSTACYTHSHTHMLCPQHATLRATQSLSIECYTQSHTCAVSTARYTQNHIHTVAGNPPHPHTLHDTWGQGTVGMTLRQATRKVKLLCVRLRKAAQG